MLTEPITVERDGHVLLIGVNRPAKRNAVNLAAMDALCGAYEILGTDEQLRAGVLFAHGDHFSAGLDLAEVGPAVAGHGPQVLYGSHRFDPFGVWRDPVPKPVVMAVNGIAFTLSVELALAADIVIAADDVRFGSWRSAGVSCRSRGHLPRARAARLGQRDALPAHRRRVRRRRGAADRAGAGGGAGRGARPAGHGTGASCRAAGPAGRTGHAGQRACQSRGGPDAGRDTIASLLPGIMGSQDAAEGLRSFLERREAHFTGH